MSINKKYLPEIDKLKKEFKLYGQNAFIDKYAKVEFFMGSIESIEFIERVLSEGKIPEKIDEKIVDKQG